MTAEARVVLTTVGTDADAVRLARGLVDMRLAACVNIVPNLRSIYRWKTEVSDERELLLVIKTQASRLNELRAAVLATHPYELPEFIVLTPADVSPDYAAWLDVNTRE